MQQDVCSIEIIRERIPIRGVAWLIFPENSHVDAKGSFDQSDVRKQLNTGLDYWLEGHPNKRLFHGWDQSEFNGKYQKCFVFKCRKDSSEHRFYGFLDHPDPEERRYMLCVLTCYGCKTTWKTDITYLERVLTLNNNQTVQRVIEEHYSKRRAR